MRALILLSLVASAAGATEPEATTSEPRDLATTAAPIEAELRRVDPAAILQPPPQAAEPAPGSPMPSRGERPKLGLCDGS
jgi:hypothetical protein